MRFRITKTTDGPTSVLHVDGELLGEGVRELERAAAAVRPLRLDLTNLLRADAAGLAALRRLAAAGVQLTGLSSYFALLLERAAGDR